MSDVPGYLSRYEELLKYLIENGENSEDDFEYVLYTLNQSMYTLYTTAEKPVKSAILKGQTLVNLITNSSSNEIINIDKRSDGFITTLLDAETEAKINYLMPTFELSTQYTLVFNSSHDFVLYIGYDSFTSNGWSSFDVAKGLNKITLTSLSTNPYPDRNLLLRFFPTKLIEITELMLLKGDYTNQDIPYFEGMQSVKMPVLTTYNSNIFPFKEYIEGTGATEDKDYIYVKGNFDYIIPLETDGNIYTLYFDGEVIKSDSFGEWKFIFEDGTERGVYLKPSTTSVDTLNKKLIGLKLRNPFNAEFKLKKSSLCFNLKSIGQEPYKTNILSTPEDVTLRGIGDVEDELDCLTGEVTERISEVVLDGVSIIPFQNTMSNQNNTIGFDFKKSFSYLDAMIIHSLNDTFPDYCGQYLYDNDVEGLSRGWDCFSVRINKDRLAQANVDGFKQWLQSNPITVQHELGTESIKTVDLTVVDQDNQPTELGTFENITHVSLEAENLIPEVEMEVATNLLEDTVFNLTDAFNTIYPTAAKPVKSATLSGQTLVNLINLENFTSSDMLYTCELPVTNNTTYTVIATLRGSDKIKTSTESVFRIKANTNNGDDLINIQQIMPNDISTIINLCRTIKITTQNNLHIRLYNTLPENLKIIILEGDHTQEDIPYFEGMQSVKMPVLTTTGKNLLKNINWETDKRLLSNGELGASIGNSTTNYINVSNLGVITFSGFSKSTHCFYDINKNVIGQRVLSSAKTIDVGSAYYIRITIDNTVDHSNPQMEVGSVATPYEPYQSNILTVNEDVTLRGIGDVQDTLDLMTGEVTERIGEIVLDGSEDWKNQSDPKWNNDTHISFRFKLNNMAPNRWDSRKINCISDKFTTKLLNNTSYILDEEFIGSDGSVVGVVNLNIKLL